MSYLYVALGDSLSAGVGTSLFSPGFVQRYKRIAEYVLKVPVFLRVFAYPGYKTADILKEMKKNYIKESIIEADIITITAGGNDLIFAARQYLTDKNEDDFKKALKLGISNMTKILDTIHNWKKEADRPYIIRMVNLYNPIPKEEIAAKWVGEFNKHLKKLAILEHVRIADIQKAFKGYESDFLSIDGIHPNDMGYDRIAELLNRLGYKELRDTEEE